MKKPSSRLMLLSPALLIAPVLLATAALPVPVSARPMTRRAPAATCGCSMKTHAHVAARRADAPADNLPDLHDLSPSERFNAFLNNFQAVMSANGVGSSALQVTYYQQMVYTPPSGLPVTFGSDGYLASVESGAQGVRYHHAGVATFGYDIKDPNNGYPNYTTILSTQWNDDDYILSSTWEPTGETTTYDPPPAATPMSSGGGGTAPGGGAPPPAGGGTGASRIVPQQQVSQTQQAKADFNDRERTIKNSRKDCNAAATNGYTNCLATQGVAITVASGLAGAGLGGLVGGPPGVGGGAIVGVGIGGAASIAGCVAQAIAAINQCTATYRNDTNKNVAQYNADIARASSNPGSN